MYAPETIEEALETIVNLSITVEVEYLDKNWEKYNNNKWININSLKKIKTRFILMNLVVMCNVCPSC